MHELRSARRTDLSRLLFLATMRVCTGSKSGRIRRKRHPGRAAGQSSHQGFFYARLGLVPSIAHADLVGTAIRLGVMEREASGWGVGALFLEAPPCPLSVFNPPGWIQWIQCPKPSSPAHTR
jgi:hypothetical protein